MTIPRVLCRKCRQSRLVFHVDWDFSFIFDSSCWACDACNTVSPPFHRHSMGKDFSEQRNINGRTELSLFLLLSSSLLTCSILERVRQSLFVSCTRMWLFILGMCPCVSLVLAAIQRGLTGYPNVRCNRGSSEAPCMLTKGSSYGSVQEAEKSPS